MGHIYIVTSGEYSDYGINGVFSTFEKACKVAFQDRMKHIDGYYSRVEIHPLDEENSDVKIYEVEKFMDNFSKMHNQQWRCKTVNTIQAPLGEVIKDWRGYSVYLLEEDEQSALKVANDLITPFEAQDTLQ